MKPNMKALIVEDSLTQAEEIKYLLENNEYKVWHASDAGEALVLLNQHVPDVIISDIVMPGKNGYELCRDIKSNSNFKDIPVILLTSLSDPSDIIKGLDCGADTFITKPYNEEFLLSKIEYLIVNFRIRKHQSTDIGLEVYFSGKKHLITSSRLQIVDLLFSTYENAVLKNNELKVTNDELKLTQSELSKLNKNLEKKVVERTQNINDINAVLRAIRNINQLIIKEKDRGELIKEACSIIIKTNVFQNAWIALTDKDGMITDFVEDGIKKELSNFNKNDFNDYIPYCIKKSLSTDDILLIQEPKTECEGCPRDRVKKRIDSAEMAICLKSKRKCFGVMVVSLPTHFIEDNEQQYLFKEIAEDIAFALYNIDLEEQRELAEERQALTARILSILNRQNEWQKLLNDILIELKNYTGFEAIGIRLQDEEDFPYFETNGYSSEFVKSDSFLCSTDNNNEIIRDSNGKAKLECLCGKIISGGIHNHLPFYTQTGSFWTNNYSKLLSGGLPNDLQIPENNLCQSEGYESIALIPLRSGKKTIGLLQINDKRLNLFDLEMIHFFEEIGFTLGIAYKRMQAEELIKESEQRFRSSLQNSKTTVSNQDMDLKYTWIYNSALGIDDEIVIGKTHEEIYNTKDAKVLTELKRSVLETENRVNSILKLTINGNPVYKEFTIEPLFGKDGQIIGVSSISTDITELEKAKLKAEESDKLKSSFLANMSHEVRTPMNGIIGFSQFLKDPDLTQENKLRYINIINEGCQQLLGIIEDILEISKLETDQIEIINEEFDAEQIVNTVFINYKEICEQKGLELKQNIEIPDIKKLLYYDKDKTSQILNKLLNNAVKFTQEGKIEIGASYKTDHIEFFVRDTGIGIDSEIKEKIFERFRQAETSMSRTYGGTGLGLAIAKGYTGLMQGDIWVDSELGSGSTFYFTIPYQKIKAPLTGSEIEEVYEPIISFNEALVLIAEDEEINFQYIKRVFNGLGVENIIRAYNGSEAVDICTKRDDIDLVIMDLKMPIMSGFEATRQIKLLNANIPVVAQTALAIPEDEKKALDAGCDDYISKPINYDKLLKIIEKYIKIK